jgi:Tannase and feruloyl esterase
MLRNFYHSRPVTTKLHQFHRRVEGTAKLGQSTVDRFFLFYVTPGASHAGKGVSSVDGAPLPGGIDLLAEIDDWVDQGIAPDALIQVAQEAKPPFAVTASRPMCRYPQWPRYVGGPPKYAASFSCVSDRDWVSAPRSPRSGSGQRLPLLRRWPHVRGTPDC